MGFLTNPAMKVYGEGEWILIEPLAYQCESNEVICAPAGFITDLASIPSFAQSLIPVNDAHRLPAIIHDYLFVIQDRGRSEVDSVFLEAMKSAGVSWWKRSAMYSAVRVGGWLFWNSNAERLKNDRANFLAENGLN